MANTVARAYNGCLGLCLQRGPEEEPVVRVQGRSLNTFSASED